MTLLSNHFYPGVFFCANQCVIDITILVDAAAGYGLPPSQSFYFSLWASRRLYCHNNNNIPETGTKEYKIQRYENRNKLNQNRLFQTGPRTFYVQLNGDKNKFELTADSEEAKQLWESIWSLESTHDKDAEWLKKLKEETEFPQQAELCITIDTVTQFLKNVLKLINNSLRKYKGN